MAWHVARDISSNKIYKVSLELSKTKRSFFGVVKSRLLMINSEIVATNHKTAV